MLLVVGDTFSGSPPTVFIALPPVCLRSGLLSYSKKDNDDEEDHTGPIFFLLTVLDGEREELLVAFIFISISIHYMEL